MFRSAMQIARAAGAAASRAVVLLPLCLMAQHAVAGVLGGVAWPGAAPCDTTLQACITGLPPGSTVVIVTSDPIDETLNIQNRSFGLRAAEGQRARFAPGRDLFIGVAPISADVEVSLQGLDFADGTVSVSFNNAGHGVFTLRDLRLQPSAPATFGGTVRVSALGGVVDARIEDVRILGRPLHANAGLIELASDGAELNAEVFHNTVIRSNAVAGDGAGINVNAVRGASGTIKLHGNTVRGGFFRGGIHLSEGLFSPLVSDYAVRVFNNVVVGPPGGAAALGNGNGIAMTVGSGRIHAVVVNNTVTRVSRGIAALRWEGAGATAEVEGTVANNLIVALLGLELSVDLAARPTNSSNLINAGSNNATLGAGTITAPAQLTSNAHPRLRASSPAVDAADTALLGLGLVLNGLPTTDADGLRRLQGPNPVKADIGAYEYGSTSFLHTATPDNIISHQTDLDHPSTASNPSANVFATPANGDSVPYAVPFGVYGPRGTWTIFSQNLTGIVPGTRFDIFVPGAGSGNLRHLATATNSAGSFTSLDDSALNTLADRIVLVTQNWMLGTTYNAHPVGTFYNGTNWFIDNLDGATMPVGAGFNVYAQQPSPNAFRVMATPGSTQVRLVHPLLDGNPCAQPQVTRQYDGDLITTHFDVRYRDGGWVVDTFGAPTTDGTQFHVLVVPAQAEVCGAVLFGDGFE